QKHRLKTIERWRWQSDIGLDASTAINFPPAVGAPYFSRLDRFTFFVEIVVIRFPRIIALDEASTRRVKPCCCQSDASATAQFKDRLHQPFSKTGLPQDKAAVVILNGASHNLRTTRAVVVNQHHHGVTAEGTFRDNVA